MKTKIIMALSIITSLIFGSVVFAGDLAGFVVKVDPSTVKKGEPVDLIVKAIDEDGNVIEDYEGDIVIMVKDGDKELDNNDYVAPNDGVYTFTKQDMGSKVFTKGLIINKEGSFKVRVEDFNTSKFGQADIKVVSKNVEKTGKIEITTPQDGETITDSTVTIAGTAKNYINSKFQVFVDGQSKAEGLVDEGGNFQVDLTNLSNQEHKIQVKVLDFNDKVVASSDPITITVKAQKKLFKGIKLEPSGTVDQGTKVIITVKVDSSVSSVTLHIPNYGDFPMNRQGLDTFITNLNANIPGKSDISLDLVADGGKKSFNNVAKLVVVEKKAIKNVTFTRDNSKKVINLNWKFTGQISSFKVLYGTGHGKYTKQAIVSENKYTIKDVDETKTYFVKIIPVDSNGNKIGDESKEVVIEPNMQKSASCTVDNIKTKVISKNNKHYLTWDKAPGAVKYVIFKGDDPTNLEKVTELTGTEYQLPFNPKAKEVKYAYFTVKAVCDDGTMKQIDKVRKVKVGPADWLIYAIFITLIVYGLKLAFREN